MDLKEAKEILTNIIDDEVIGTYCIEIQKEGVPCDINCEDKDCYLHTAIETILQELDNSISKDKIREKIEEIAGKQGYVFATEVLGDLLKEE